MLKISDGLKLRIYEIELCLIAFLLPVHPKILVLSIILFVLSWIVFDGASFRFHKLDLKKTLPLILYLFYIIGLCWTFNFDYGLKDISTKLSLLIFPLVISNINFDRIKLKGILDVFIIGNAVSLIYCIYYLLTSRLQGNYTVEALYNDYILNNDFYFASYISKILHPSYSAMYLNLCIAILLFEILNGKSYFFLIVKLILCIVFSTFLFFLASKAGIISLFFLIFIFLLASLITKKKILISSVLFFGSIFLVVYIFNNSRVFSARIKEAYMAMNNSVVGDTSSSASRTHVWKSSLEIIKRHPLIGIGTGDTRAEMEKQNMHEGFNFEARKNLNSHNQFLQTSVAIGICGGLILMLALIFPITGFVLKSDYLGICFLTLIIINFLFESMLETQAGVVFFSFFYSLFVVKESSPTLNKV